jgi:competence protein ComEA
MRISEFSRQKVKSFFSFLHSQFAIHDWQLPKYLSLSQQRILFVLALLILGLLYFRFYYHPRPPHSEGIMREFVVEVSGEVANPGIHFFQNPPTLKEAIEKAGGFRGGGHFESPASSETLETGTSIKITKESKDEIKIHMGRMEAHKLLVFSISLDLNRASVEDLCLIPGIGESLASEIVTYRERRKGFRSLEELKNVKGIGEKKYQTFKAFFTAGHPVGADSSGLKP